MLTLDLFHNYQDDSVTQLYERPRVLAIMPTGAGKTIVALTAFKELQRDGFVRQGVLLGPKRVAVSVWPSEPIAWAHTQGMSIVPLNGTTAQRVQYFGRPADIYTVGAANVVWLLAQVKTWDKNDPRFDQLIVDEASIFKDPRGSWSKALRKLAKMFRGVWLLTGTPRPNSDLDYFVYMDIVTQASMWPRSYDIWRREYFYPIDYNQHDWRPHTHLLEGLYADVAKWSFKVPESVVPRPKSDPIPHVFKLPPQARAIYDKMERELFATVKGEDVVAFSKAIASGKLAQIAQGFIYDDDKTVRHIHDEKMGVLEGLIDNSRGNASVVFYHFNEDLRRIKDALPGFEYLGEGVSDKRALEIEHEFNAGNIEKLGLHPASAGHGLNLQKTPAQLCQYTPTWSAELYDQAVARVARQGYVGTLGDEWAGEWMVPNHFIIAENTVDRMKVDRVANKLTAQEAALEYIKSVRT